MSARYLCLRCWRISSPAETLPAETAAAAPLEPEVPVPVAALEPEDEPLPVPVAIAAPDPLPAARPQPRAGLHWIEDPNPQPILPVTAVPARAAVVAEKPALAKATQAEPKSPEAPRKSRWSGWVDSLLGEADEGEGGRRSGENAAGNARCRCGASLAADLLLEAPPALLGFAGAPGSGKRFLLLSMLHQLELAEGSEGGRRRPILEPLGDTGEIVHARRRDLFRHGRRPAAAETDAGYAWQLSFAPSVSVEGRSRRRPLPGGRAQLVGFLGVDAGAAEADAGRYHALLERVVLTLDGAVLAADLDLESGDAWSEPLPAGDLGAADQRQFASLCRGLGPRARDTVLAIVVTKVDLLATSSDWAGLGPGGDLAGAEREAAIARLLKETWRGPLLEEAKAKFRRVGLFAGSSLGFRPAAEDLGGNGELTRRPQPWEILAPLDFLLDDLAPRRRA